MPDEIKRCSCGCPATWIIQANGSPEEYCCSQYDPLPHGGTAYDEVYDDGEGCGGICGPYDGL